MPAKSKRQARFMRAVASGSVKKAGLSKKEALEFVSGHSTKGLPEKKGSKSVPKVKKVAKVRAGSGHRTAK